MKMRLVDAHCHLESEEFAGDLDRVIDRARAAGIVKLITASITPEQWEISRSIAARYREVEYAAGIHPWYIREPHLSRIPELVRARERGAVAIGEIGIDRKIDRGDFELQMIFFERQLAVAREIDLPVIIHCRGAFNECAMILRRDGAPKAGGVIHAFSGSPEVAVELADLGMSFSIGGTLTMRNSRKREAVLRAIYPDRFLLETDAPDIPPVQARGGTNYPHYILHNLRAAAEILGENEETVAERTTANALRIFRLEESVGLSAGS